MNEIVAIATMPQDEFERIVKRIEDNLERVKDILLEDARDFARMSYFQLKEAKKRLSRLVSSSSIDRLVLLGRGYPLHLCNPFSGAISASVVRRLPKATLDRISNPKAEIAILATDGNARVKQAQRLTSLEWSQVIGRNGELLSPTKQRLIRETGRPAKTKTDTAELEKVEKILIDTERQVLKLYGVDGGGMEVSIAMIRKLVV